MLKWNGILIIVLMCGSSFYLILNVSSQNAKENKMLLEKKTEACHKQKKEIRQLKKWIAEYQLLMRAGASGLHKVTGMCEW